MVRGLNKFDSLMLLNFTLALFRPISDMGTGKSLQRVRKKLIWMGPTFLEVDL
jgi:hypothetical protein